MVGTSFVLALFCALIFIAVSSYIEDKKIDKFWKDWEENSFEWNGFRLSKDMYEIVDGELVVKANE